MKAVQSSPVICCPNRLYANNYQILNEVADFVFQSGLNLVAGPEAHKNPRGTPFVAVFGKRWGGELRLPARRRRASYFVDWILALVSGNGKLEEFVAVEVQTIDTTGSYRAEHDAYLHGETFQGHSTAGLNWENVSKRILPQVIYKGHVLRREPLCRKGMFFICPSPVYERIIERLGGTLLGYKPQPGSLTFRWYDLGQEERTGKCRGLSFAGQRTTTVDQIAAAFTSPSNLPDEGVYERAIRNELERR